MPDVEQRLLVGHFRGRDTNQEVHLLEGAQVQVLGAGIRNRAHMREELLSHGQLEGPGVAGLRPVTCNQSRREREAPRAAGGPGPGPLLGNQRGGPVSEGHEATGRSGRLLRAAHHCDRFTYRSRFNNKRVTGARGAQR